jgi:hypothetical protein
MHPFLSTNKTHIQKFKEKKKFHNGALAPIAGFLLVPVG